jgi:hypothetical protein
MKLVKASILLIVCDALLIFIGSAAAQTQNKDFVLGFGACTPAVFLKLYPEIMVKVSEIVYAPTGALDSYKEEIHYSSNKPVILRVAVNHEKWTGMCTSLEYAVEVDGKRLISPTVEAFQRMQPKDVIAFSTEEFAGVLLGGDPLEADFKTEFGYDQDGRKKIRRQTYARAGSRYQVLYSDYSYDHLGRLLSYSAQVNEVK